MIFDQLLVERRAHTGVAFFVNLSISLQLKVSL